MKAKLLMKSVAFTDGVLATSDRKVIDFLDTHSGNVNVKRILFLTLKKKWFDMIYAGIKNEEYRELKPYWIKRLFKDKGMSHLFNEFDIIRFTNGYRKNAPWFDIECKGIEIKEGVKEWGAEENELYFVIKLGNLIIK